MCLCADPHLPLTGVARANVWLASVAVPLRTCAARSTVRRCCGCDMTQVLKRSASGLDIVFIASAPGQTYAGRAASGLIIGGRRVAAALRTAQAAQRALSVPGWLPRGRLMSVPRCLLKQARTTRLGPRSPILNTRAAMVPGRQLQARGGWVRRRAPPASGASAARHSNPPPSAVSHWPLCQLQSLLIPAACSFARLGLRVKRSQDCYCQALDKPRQS